jgi:hypothetical protein
VDGIGVFQIAPIHLDGGLNVGRQVLQITAVISPVIPDDDPYHPAIETLTFLKKMPRLLILYPDDYVNEIWRVRLGYNLADLRSATESRCTMRDCEPTMGTQSLVPRQPLRAERR